MIEAMNYQDISKLPNDEARRRAIERIFGPDDSPPLRSVSHRFWKSGCDYQSALREQHRALGSSEKILGGQAVILEGDEVTEGYQIRVDKLDPSLIKAISLLLIGDDKTSLGLMRLKTKRVLAAMIALKVDPKDLQQPFFIKITELSVSTGHSVVSVENSVRELVGAGLIERRQGLGTVRGPVGMGSVAATKLTDLAVTTLFKD